MTAQLRVLESEHKEAEHVETSTELAKRWGVTRGRIHQLIQSGDLRAVRMGRDWMILGRPERGVSYKLKLIKNA